MEPEAAAPTEEMEMDEYDLVFDHQCHGRNIKIEEGGRVALKMKKGAKEALVVTNRQMMTDELFEVEVGGASGFKGVRGEMKAMLKGKESIRIGVTIHPPSDICQHNTQHSMKRMNNTWMMMSESIIVGGEVIKTFNKFNLKEVQIGTRVGIVRVPEFNGSLLIYLDGAPIGIIATGVSDKIYGFVELQGDCERVNLCPIRNIKDEELPLEIHSMREKIVEVAKLKDQLTEKEEQLKVSNEQLETLRKQLVILRETYSKNGITNGTLKNGVKENQETQTSTQNTPNGSLCSQSEGAQRQRRKRGCTIL